MYALPPANFASTAPAQPVHQPAPEIQTAPTIVQQVTIEQVPARSDLLVETDHWGWSELRDYVASEIISRFGPFPRDSRKEYGIFNRYFGEFGQDGIKVAQFAFGPVCDGWWGGAPVSINRFCRASDPYFSIPILDRLAGRA